ncbi:MAG: pseudaminic acid biosynthesis-associated methylase [Kofleriaceae bacterium]
MQTSSQLALWRSEFGRDYTDRNDVAKPERIVSWQRLLEGIVPQRAVEVGCNVGWNLTYLQELGVKELYAVEPQPYAVEKARARNPAFNVLCGTGFDLPFKDGFADLAFTSGVLIHIAPADLAKVMAEMYRVSRRYVVAIEYDWPVEEEIKYRGNGDSLWKRPHGAIWQARYPALRLVRKLELAPEDGYDHCTAHLFEKVG